MSGPATVLVAGTGLAGLAAAISAREAGAAVTVIEKGDVHDRGGNTVFSGGAFLFSHGGAEDLTSLTDRFAPSLRADSISAPPYTVEQYVADLQRASGGRSDATLARTLAEESLATMRWLVAHGVELEFGAFGAYVRDGVLHVPAGESLQAAGEGFARGAGIVMPLIECAERAGVEFRYATALRDLIVSAGRVRGAVVETGDGVERLAADAMVLASGGYQGSAEMRREHLGAEWGLARVRGSRLCTGDGINAGLRAGADGAGDWSVCHTAAIDPTTPSPERNDAPTPIPLHGFWLGIMVNRHGRRFVDEGPGLWANNYARMGKAVIRQPGNAAVQIFDQKTAELAGRHQPTAPPIVAGSLRELAAALDLPAAALEETVAAFNAACGDAPFDPEVVDGLATTGIEPPKSNWAVPLDTPPFVAYRAMAGLTFTFSGLRVDVRARVLDRAGTAIPGLFAAGESTGGLFYGDYPGGAGLTRSGVFGRIAGRQAAGRVEQGSQTAVAR